jgi:hypothetical protein
MILGWIVGQRIRNPNRNDAVPHSLLPIINDPCHQTLNMNDRWEYAGDGKALLISVFTGANDSKKKKPSAPTITENLPNSSHPSVQEGKPASLAAH